MRKNNAGKTPSKPAHKPSDEELVLAHQSGDATAFERLFRRYSPLVKNRAALSVSDTLPYEDLLQEGMVGLFKAVQAYDAAKSVPFAAFATTVIENQVADAVKREQRIKNRILSDAISWQALNDEVAEHDAQALESQEDLLQLLIIREHDFAIQKQLQEILSKNEYAVLSLRLKGYSYDQIAELKKLSSKQVDNSLQRAKRKIKTAGFLV